MSEQLFSNNKEFLILEVDNSNLNPYGTMVNLDKTLDQHKVISFTNPIQPHLKLDLQGKVDQDA